MFGPVMEMEIVCDKRPRSQGRVNIVENFFSGSEKVECNHLNTSSGVPLLRGIIRQMSFFVNCLKKVFHLQDSCYN